MILNNFLILAAILWLNDAEAAKYDIDELKIILHLIGSHSFLPDVKHLFANLIANNNIR